MMAIPLISLLWPFNLGEPPPDSSKAESKGHLEPKKPAKTHWKVNLHTQINKINSIANPVSKSINHQLDNSNSS
jgi:hypothetical protein